MKAKKNVSYFPVSAAEQALLLRVREADLAGRVEELVVMLDQIAQAGVTSADLEQAFSLLAQSKQGEGLDARFDNLEARLRERIERALLEAQGRLSQLLAGHTEPNPSFFQRSLPSWETAEEVANSDIPEQASVAFRVEGDLVWGVSAAQFYVAVWRWLFEHRLATRADLPIQGGKKRYVVATSPIHPSGNEFTRAEQPVPGVYVEVNLARTDIIRRAKKYLAHFGAEFEILVGLD